MRKNQKILFGTLSTVATTGTVLAAVSCSQKVEAEDKIAIAIPNQAAIDLLEQEVMIKGYKSVRNTTSSQVDQNEWINSAIEHNASALLISPIDDKVNKVVKLASEKAIPVIAFDKLIKEESSNYNWYITYDHDSKDKQRLANVASIILSVFLHGEGHNPTVPQMQKQLTFQSFDFEFEIVDHDNKYKVGNKFIKTVIVEAPQT